MILIITDRFDTHADAVIKKLKQLGASYFRLNLDVDELKRTTITYKNDQWTILQRETCLSSSTIACVWPRRLTVSLTLEQQAIQENSFKLWRAEWNRSLYGLYSSLRESFWMNPIAESSLMDNKFLQLKKASAIGFNVPRFITSNSKSDLIEFAKRNLCALKFMSQDIYAMPDGSFSGIYVNKITLEDLQEFGGTFENPVTLQEYIEKAYEVRYTYVGGEHFACKIDSQSSTLANIDWRRYDVANTPHYPITPPKDIKILVEKLMKEARLHYGAFDFIVDRENKWWYLEVNTAGQWLWIEDLTGLGISEKIASFLTKHGAAE